MISAADDSQRVPLIVDIKRFSLEDGPGIRTVAFFKGCPLRCVFCQNPETQNIFVEARFSQRRCIRCGACQTACVRGAISFPWFRLFRRRRNEALCAFCGQCEAACPRSATKIVGNRYSIEELSTLLLKDASFFSNSGGGITLSGGECLLFLDYVSALLKNLKINNVHTLIQTAGLFCFEDFAEKVLPHVDMIYFDIKFVDDVLHKKFTHVSNQVILGNFGKLAAAAPGKLQARIPLIPGMTATKENLRAITALLHRHNINSVSLLPYNPGGIEKSIELGRPSPKITKRFMTPNELLTAKMYRNEPPHAVTRQITN